MFDDCKVVDSCIVEEPVDFLEVIVGKTVNETDDAVAHRSEAFLQSYGTVLADQLNLEDSDIVA